MTPADIPAVVPMEHRVWHDYYRQYPFYDTIAESVTHESLTQDWNAFFTPEDTADRQSVSACEGETAPQPTLVTGHDRVAYVACEGDTIVGVAAASAYVEGKWPAVDALLRKPDGSLTKTAKFQNLYIDAAYRRQGIGKLLSRARAGAMLEKGYESLFITVFDGATHTIAYHEKNGLTQVHEYESLQTFKDGRHLRILCFLHQDLREWNHALNC